MCVPSITLTIKACQVLCITHRVSLTLVVQGFPVRWESIKVQKVSGSCPLCRAHKEGVLELQKAVKKWTFKAKEHPEILTDGTKESKKDSDKENSMNYTTQQSNRQRLREENNKRVAREYQLKRGAPAIPPPPPEATKRRPNHLKLIKD